jgi:hypothetical protein
MFIVGIFDNNAFFIFVNQKTGLTRNNKAFFWGVLLALLSIFAHWQAITVIPMIILFQVVTSEGFTSFARSKTLKLFTSRIILVLIFILTCVLSYSIPQIFTVLALNFSSIFYQSKLPE